jgi:hypothetical protein
MRSPRAVPALVLLGVLVVQVAWILALPPFAAFDEFDQAYRADAVAHGEWLAHGTPKHGRGGLVTVPRDIVSAAHAQCSALKYTGHDNCNPAEVLPDGEVRVASAASRYHPAFYWVVGSAARPFRGADALYVMRFTGALICALGIAVATWCIRRRTTSRWPVLGLLLALSPVLLYSTTIPAPNGLEMVAGLVLWSTLLSLDAARRPGDGWVLLWAVVAAVLLVTLRTLGPLFAALIVVCVLMVRRRQLRGIVLTHRWPLAAGLLVTAAATVASVAWILLQSPLGTSATRSADIDPKVLADASYGVVLQVVPLGNLQAIASAPLRGTPAPTVVYAAYGLLLLALFATALRHTRGSARQGLVLALVLSQLVPVAVSAAGLKSVGLVWQGRYGLPLVAGMTVLACVLLAEAWLAAPAPAVIVLVGGLYALAQVLAVGAVIRLELGDRTSVADPGWWQTSTPVVVGVAALGLAVMAGAVLLDLRAGRRPVIASP